MTLNKYILRSMIKYIEAYTTNFPPTETLTMNPSNPVGWLFEKKSKTTRWAKRKAPLIDWFINFSLFSGEKSNCGRVPPRQTSHDERRRRRQWRRRQRGGSGSTQRWARRRRLSSSFRCPRILHFLSPFSSNNFSASSDVSNISQTNDLLRSSIRLA